MYLGEVCHEIYEVFGLEVSPSTICRLLLSYGITRDLLRGAYMAQSFMFSTDKFVWIDETGSDA